MAKSVMGRANPVNSADCRILLFLPGTSGGSAGRAAPPASVAVCFTSPAQDPPCGLAAIILRHITPPCHMCLQQLYINPACYTGCILSLQ